MRNAKGLRDSRADEADAQATFHRRALLLAVGHAAVWGCLAGRLYQLQVLEGDGLAALADQNRTRQTTLLPLRGRILDARGRVLASSRETFRIVAPRSALAGRAEDAARVSRVVQVLGLTPTDEGDILAKLRRSGARGPVVLLDGLTFEQVAKLQVQVSNFAPFYAEAGWVRAYHARSRADAEAMSHIVGYVGAVDRRALDDDPVLRASDARIGKAGVEGGMDVELRGIAGVASVEVDARGRTVKPLGNKQPVPGRDVALTIDTALQSQVIARLQREARPGAAVVLDVLTGDVLAMASTPTFDPADLSGAGSRQAWLGLNTAPDHPLLNRAIAGQYPPGSTFKLVTALAALEAGTISSREKIECWGDVTYAGHTFRCWNRKGHITSDLHKALRESCDCYFYEAARRTGIDAVGAMASRLGLGQTYEAGIAQQKAGLVPTPLWKRSRGKSGWLIGDTIQVGIGQGYVLATPMQLAVMTARIATGLAVFPSLVARPPNDPPPAFVPLAISPTALIAVRRGMVAVVNEPSGTGQAAGLDDGRPAVAGKTGTSQVSKRSADRDRTAVLKTEHRDHALFVAYVPADQPRFAVSVVLEHAGGGGAMAAPVARDIIELVLDHPRALPAATSKVPEGVPDGLPPVVRRADAG